MSEDLPGLLYDMRARQALLIAALLQLGGELLVTRRQATECAEYDAVIYPEDGGLRVRLRKIEPT